MKQKVHFTNTYLLNPVHRITVDLIGAGGNGSQMLSCLARIDYSLRKLGRTGLYVTVYDNDNVDEPNIGRQLFTACDIGKNKAECLVTRFNRIYGNDWKACADKYRQCTRANIIISCVDNVQTRIDIGKSLMKKSHGIKENCNYYWMDLGNGQTSGQCVIGTGVTENQPRLSGYQSIKCMKNITDIFDLTVVDEADSGPSCSLAEALVKQDLFINSALVQSAASLLWHLLNDGVATCNGFYLNIDSMRMVPIPL